MNKIKKIFIYNHKNINVILMTILAILFSVGSVYGAECLSDLSNAPCDVSADLTLDTNTYNFNLNNGSVITITAGNLVLDGNGSNIIGNLTGNAIYSGQNNITIKNINLNNYNFNLRLQGSQNSNITNNTFNNASSNVYLRDSSNSTFEMNKFSNASIYNVRADSSEISNNVTFRNNDFLSSNQYSIAFTSYQYNGTLIENNNFYSGGIYIFGSYNTIFRNNNILNKNNIYNFRFWNNSQGVSIINNIFNNSNYLINFNSDFNDIIIKGNVFYNCTSNDCVSFRNQINPLTNITLRDNSYNIFDKAISLSNVSGINIINESIYNATTGFDGYFLGIQIENSSNINISNSNISLSGCVGIFIRKSNNIIINNNLFNFNSQNNIDNKVNCGYEPITAIGIQELYKTWIGDSTESESDNRTNKIGNYSSNNITISSNIFNGFPILLKSQGTTNLTHDLDNYWFRSFQTPVHLVDRTDLYISNSWNNVSTTYSLVNNNPVVLRTILGEGYMGSTTSIKMQFEVFNNYLFFNNTNQTESYETNIYNLSNALIYYTNLSVKCETINSCDNNQNITLDAGNYSYILDNYQVSETVRANDPVSASGTATVKTITSTLVDNLTATANLTITDWVETSQLRSISIVRPNGDSTTLTSGWTNNGGVITFTLEDLPTGATVVTFIVSTCSPYEAIFYPLISLFLSLAILVFVIFFLKGDLDFKEGKYKEWDRISLKNIILSFVSIMVLIGVLNTIADTMAGRCAL